MGGTECALSLTRARVCALCNRRPQGRERGVSVARRGFWADITSPPYFALGTHCEAGAASAAHKQLFEIHAKGTGAEQHRHVRARLCGGMGGGPRCRQTRCLRPMVGR